MADNVTLPGTGQVVATKEIGGVEYQVMLLADGTYTIVNPATADKQDLLLTEMQKKADLTETQPVSAVSLPLPTGAATAVKQLADNHNVTVSNQPTGYATAAKQLADGHNVAVSNMIPAVETGLATSAKQLPDGHEVEVNNLPIEYPLPTAQVTTLTPPAAITGFATSLKQSDGTQASMFVNELGTPYGVKHVQNKPRVSAMPYLYDIAEGNVTGHTPWSKIGFNPSITTTEEDIWSAGGSYVFPTGATPMAVIGGATDDGSPAIYSGTATAGTATSITDTAKNFTTGAIVAVGDCVILEKAGTTPEWGYVTALVGTDTLTIGGGFSSGGNANGILLLYL